MPDQIQVVKPNSDIISLFQREPLCTVTKAEQVQDLLGQDVVNITVVSVEPLDLLIGQKTTIFGRTYFLNQLPTAQVKGEREFEYDLTFEGPQYLLRKAAYFNVDVSGFSTTTDFPLTGNCEMFLDVILNNLRRVFGAGSWTKGDFPTTGVKTISFNENNCLSALQSICQQFETEFDIVQSGTTHRLHIRKAGQVLGHAYQYGRGLGLYELKRQTVTTSDIVTRLYPFGSNKNLKSDYRGFSQRLKIADPGYIEDPAAIAAFGIIEGVKVWDDIYPRRTGYVSAVNGVLTFQDASMNFDLNEAGTVGTKWLIAGSNAKIHFNTGNLAGYDFEMTKYTHATKTFTLIEFEDERGMKFPNAEHAAFQIQVGDEYVILDINLPDTYVETAELELLGKGQLEYDQSKFPRVQYSLTVDEAYLGNLAGSGSIVNFYEIGDYIHILDTDLNIDKSSRVIGLRRDVLNPYKYQLTIDDTYQVSIITQIIESQKEVKTIIKTNDLRDPNRARMGWKTTLELLSMIFDTDGYFDGGKIKPESIETMMLVVGAKSQQFILQDVVFQPNFEGNANLVEVSEGLLIHYALKEEILTWNIQASTHTIPDNAARYIYAKVNKSEYTDGHIVFDTAKILPDEDPNYYHFLVGTLHSVMEDVRWISLTYGATAINGRFIKTGRVQSFDGRTYFDLDMGAIGGYIKFIDSQGNYRDLSDIGAATDVFYEVSVINPPETYVNGKITAWFQATNPATWPSGEESFHTGDMWFNSNSMAVSRRIGGAWVAVTDQATVKAYIKQYTRLGASQSIQMFTAEPIATYKEGDLWMSENGLRRSIANKVTGQPFDPNDWVEPFNFDNTATAIDGHIITSGIIQLAGDKNAIWAGVSGQGTTGTSVRFWAGASTVNRDTAPFRVLQNGWVFGRNRIEVEGMDATSPSGYKGQAGLAGSIDEDNTGIRIYAGSDYEGKGDAPFRVNGQGHAWMDIGRVGENMKIQTGSITNQGDDGLFNSEANIVFRDDPTDRLVAIGTNLMPGSAGGINTVLARVENNKVGSGTNNYSLVLEASGATADVDTFGTGGSNFNLYAAIGDSLLGGLITNGQKVKVVEGVPGSLSYVDPTKFNVVIFNANGADAFITLIKEVYNSFPGSAGTAVYEHGLRDGNEITIIATNNAHSYRIYRTIRPSNSSNLIFNGGSATTLVYYNGTWYVKSSYDNNY